MFRKPGPTHPLAATPRVNPFPLDIYTGDPQATGTTLMVRNRIFVDDWNERLCIHFHPSLEEQAWEVMSELSESSFLLLTPLFLIFGTLSRHCCCFLGIFTWKEASIPQLQWRKTKEVFRPRYNWSGMVLSQSIHRHYRIIVSSSWEGEYQLFKWKSLNGNVICTSYQPFLTVRSYAWHISLESLCSSVDSFLKHFRDLNSLNLIV